MNKTAKIYRMTGPDAVCPSGIQAKALLEKQGFTVTDIPLNTRAEIDEFKAMQSVQTTPQIFIGDQRIGGLGDLQSYLGVSPEVKAAKTYTPVIALFSVAALMALALTWLLRGQMFTGQSIAWFISIAMILLGLQKLGDLQKFSTLFRSYDLLAGRLPAYGLIYPFIETGAGLLMLAGALTWLSVPITLFAAGIGAISVFYAVYIQKRDLNCACVGGESRVPLGFVSLLENLMMVGMALWMGRLLF